MTQKATSNNTGALWFAAFSLYWEKVKPKNFEKQEHKDSLKAKWRHERNILARGRRNGEEKSGNKWTITEPSENMNKLRLHE